ncbi:SH2 domain-containing protein 1A-like [Antennarius striatus]|uniref:SH2 domain-containing protein 1A-like n=1 Tax=Antennarius striatus TaxID=241820 RepID=UPI0035AEEBAE
MMENLPVYHGPIGQEEGVRRLGQDGRDGCYLIRNSDSTPGAFCLCVLSHKCVYTYRLHKNNAGSWAAETTPGVKKRYFRQIGNLIAAFQKPGQGIAMHLLYPVTAWKQAHPEAQATSNSPSPTQSSPNSYLQQWPPHSTQGQKSRNRGAASSQLGANREQR